jgi:chemotaxis family two-component system response regulator Rcp1
MNNRSFAILIVEDNSTDVMIMREALDNQQTPTQLNAVADGITALDYLHRVGPYAGATRPDLILLDLNMPRMNGHEFLTLIKADSALKAIPVVMLTTSQAEDDLARAYAGHVNCYIRKPLDFERFSEVVRAIQHFWFSVVTLPHD